MEPSNPVKISAVSGRRRQGLHRLHAMSLHPATTLRARCISPSHAPAGLPRQTTGTGSSAVVRIQPCAPAGSPFMLSICDFTRRQARPKPKHGRAYFACFFWPWINTSPTHRREAHPEQAGTRLSQELINLPRPVYIYIYLYLCTPTCNLYRL
jgi:hypothetical protein